MFYEVKIDRDTPSNVHTGVDVYTLKNGSESISPLTRKNLKQEVFEIAPMPIAGVSLYSADEGIGTVQIDDQTKMDIPGPFERQSRRSFNSLRTSTAF